ncbi:hypothetical protein NFB56_15935 [Yersinia ruckeri]|uniref:hypothetical protein n=1 Tax=Yersinia ruckeri TaxID=29486 RepID=UPI0022386069|nr:hypothetical protein [Yersinia ruckeri]MCW6550330.1 hypothetical protein [Yersinia ruckeri]
MSLSMAGHVDAVFKSVTAVRTSTSEGSYVDGIWVPGTSLTESFVANVQPATDREIDFLTQGGERVVDVRRVYINRGSMQNIDQTGDWEFLGQKWKTVKCDNRYWRNYCKLLVTRYDEQP